MATQEACAEGEEWRFTVCSHSGSSPASIVKPLPPLYGGLETECLKRWTLGNRGGRAQERL